MSHIEEMLESKSWAVVGATDNKQKFGYKIFKFLLNHNVQVYAVNPGVSEILGHKCYPSLKDLPQRPDAVDVVVPPRVGEQIVHECAELGIKNIWLQPGADTAELIELGRQLGLNVVNNACIMIELK